MSRESKLFKNTMIIAIGNICTKCIGFLLLPLYTSILSAAEYGTVDIIGTYSALFVIILTMQFEQGIFRFLVDVRDNKEKQSQYITVVVLVCAIVVLLFDIVSIGLLKIFNYQYTFYFVAITTLNTFYAIILQIPRGLGNNTLYATGSFLNGSLNVGLNVLFVAIIGWKIEGMLCASILATAFSLFWVFFKSRLWNYVKWERRDKKSLLELVKYSLPLIPYTLCWWIVSISDRILIGHFLGMSFNGIYAIANKFPTLFSMATNIFQIAWTESASENFNAKDCEVYYNRVFEKTIRFYSSSNLTIIAVIPFIFSLIIGNEFKEAYFYIPILLTGAMFHSIAALYGSIYFAFKKTKAVSKTTVLAATINFIVNIAFINFIKLYAAAISTLLSYFMITIIRHFDVKNMVEIKIKHRYLVQECIAYFIVLSTYYIQNKVLSVGVLILTCVYCVVQNREFILLVLNIVTNGRKKK